MKKYAIELHMQNAPHIDETPATHCVVCGAGPNLRSAIACGQDYEYETCRNKWHMWQCKTCSHVQLDPRPADNTLATIYPSNYYSYNMQESVSKLALKCKSLMDQRKFRGILRMMKSPPSSYLDVGCGDGRYLKLMMNKGLPFQQVHGLEIEENAVKRAREKGLNVHYARVEDASHIADGSLDLITMFHVIEHLENPRDVVKSLAKKLRPGGMLILETPNIDSLDARIFRKSFWGGYHFPRHWHIFSPNSMRQLMETNGFTIEKVSYQPGHAFWLYSFHHFIKYKINHPKFATWIHPLHNVPALAIIVAFDLLRSWFGFRTSAMLVAGVKSKNNNDRGS
jgi:2-polyprenyl-3-methyl-5-hydroxy-6-metoxy-1,4-benzoquinol methylase